MTSAVLALSISAWHLGFCCCLLSVFWNHSRPEAVTACGVHEDPCSLATAFSFPRFSAHFGAGQVTDKNDRAPRPCHPAVARWSVFVVAELLTAPPYWSEKWTQRPAPRHLIRHQLELLDRQVFSPPPTPTPTAPTRPGVPANTGIASGRGFHPKIPSLSRVGLLPPPKDCRYSRSAALLLLLLLLSGPALAPFWAGRQFYNAPAEMFLEAGGHCFKGRGGGTARRGPIISIICCTATARPLFFPRPFFLRSTRGKEKKGTDGQRSCYRLWGREEERSLVSFFSQQSMRRLRSKQLHGYGY